jgi:glycosyltransferase involved in cell wall biosynthesis
MTRVLYVNQTGDMSGAERSLLELISGLPAGVAAGVACPDGDLAAALAQIRLRRFPLHGTEVSFRLHPRHTTQGLARMAGDAARVAVIARRARADLLHANTTRAGIVATLASQLGAPPAVVHVRDWLPEGQLAQLTLKAIQRGAAALVPNSAFVMGQLPPAPPSCLVRVIHNPVDAARFDPERVDRREARARFGFGEGDRVLTVVGQLTPWKGQMDAVRILAELRGREPGLRLLLAGSAKFADPGTRFDNLQYERELRRLIRALVVEDAVVLAGERDDVPHVLRATDVLLVPSWQEAFGRSALEGMAMGVPIVATANGGPAELVTDGREGRVLEPGSPFAWATVVRELLHDPDQRRAMGARGRERAVRDFSIAGHVAQVMALYEEVLGRARG